jgi:pseudouridine-5'-phosphate glycosidase
MIAWKAAARWRRCPDGRSIGALPIWIRRSYGLSSSFLNVSEEIQDAVAAGKPVIALESTIYTHGTYFPTRLDSPANSFTGFPYPDNVVLASLLESLVRTNGGVPATIAVFNGVARIGLEPEELIELASTAKTKSALKVSRRDLGYICGRVNIGQHLDLRLSRH